MTSGLVYVRDNPENAALLAGQLFVLDIGLDKIEAYEDSINRITLEDVKKAVSAMLSDSTYITGLLLPEQSREGE